MFRTYAKHFKKRFLSFFSNVVIPAQAGIHKKTCGIALKISYLYLFSIILSTKILLDPRVREDDGLFFMILAFCVSPNVIILMACKKNE
jgi:hypothetical protein